MMTKPQFHKADGLLCTARAALDQAEAGLKTERSTIRRLASNDLSRAHPDYRVLILLARAQEQRWQLAEAELEVIVHCPNADRVLPPAVRLGWRGRLRAVVRRLSPFVREESIEGR